MSTEADDLAAAWGEALDAEASPSNRPPAATPDATRVLNQQEIDSLLGFGSGARQEEERSGIQRIVSAGLVSYERLPMLEIIFDRLVRIMSTSLRNFTSDNVEVSIDSIVLLRFGDYLNSVPLPAMLAVFEVEEWDNYGLIVVDSALIYPVVDVLLGGRRGTAAMRIEGRPYTTIERTLVERLITVVLDDLSDAFSPLSPARFRFERLEVNPRFAAVSQLSNACILSRLRVDMEDRGGKIELLPYATLEPIREPLLQQFMGEIRPGQYLGDASRRGAAAHRAVDGRGARRADHAAGRGDVAAAGRPHHAECRARWAGAAALRRRDDVRGGARPAGEPHGGPHPAQAAAEGGGVIMGWYEWSAQLLLIGLLVAAIPCILKLERTLAAVRRDREALEAGAAGLGEATRMAEAASLRLRATAEGAGRQVAERLAAAEPMRDDLRYLVERAEGLADRLEGLVRAARPMASPEPALAVPSQAERDLLRALSQGLGGARGGP
jgi:flagellar motor switch protein FliM